MYAFSGKTTESAATTGDEGISQISDDANIKPQAVTLSENITLEDEGTLESDNDERSSFFENIKYSLLMIIVVFVGMIGGTVGSWIGSLADPWIDSLL